MVARNVDLSIFFHAYENSFLRKTYIPAYSQHSVATDEKGKPMDTEALSAIVRMVDSWAEPPMYEPDQSVERLVAWQLAEKEVKTARYLRFLRGLDPIEMLAELGFDDDAVMAVEAERARAHPVPPILLPAPKCHDEKKARKAELARKHRADVKKKRETDALYKRYERLRDKMMDRDGVDYETADRAATLEIYGYDNHGVKDERGNVI